MLLLEESLKKHYRWNLLTSLVRNEGDGRGWWIRCNWAPLQWTTWDSLFGPIDLLHMALRIILSLVWCHHEWEVISTNHKEPKLCVWCGSRSFDAVNTCFLGKCYSCGHRKRKLREWSWTTGPGTGQFGNFCDDCWESRPKNWEEKVGMTMQRMSPNAKFVQYVGAPQVTAAKHGPNAYGSVLAEYDDGSRIGVMCEHGGSAWLCLGCAEKLVGKEANR